MSQTTATELVDRILMCGVLSDTSHGCLPHPATVAAATAKIAYALDTSDLVLKGQSAPEVYLRDWLAGAGKFVAVAAATGQVTIQDREAPNRDAQAALWLAELRVMATQYAYLACVAHSPA
jgi:hypothetical protein